MILRSALKFAQQQANIQQKPVYVLNGRYYKNLDDAPTHPCNDGYYHISTQRLSHSYDCYTIVPE